MRLDLEGAETYHIFIMPTRLLRTPSSEVMDFSGNPLRSPLTAGCWCVATQTELVALDFQPAERLRSRTGRMWAQVKAAHSAPGQKRKNNPRQAR